MARRHSLSGNLARLAAIWLGVAVLAGAAMAETAPSEPNSPAASQPGPVPVAAPIAAPVVVPAMAPAQARAALDVLQNDAERARLIGVLQAIAGASPSQSGATAAPPAVAAPPPAPAPAPAPTPAEKVPAVVLAPNSIGAELLFSLSDHLGGLTNAAMATVRSATDFPLLWHWLQRLGTNRQTQAAILDAAWRLILVMGLGLAAEFVVVRALRRPLASLRRRAPVHIHDMPEDVQGLADAEAGQMEKISRRASVLVFVRRLPFMAGCFALDLLPVLAVLATGYGLLAAGMAGTLTSRLVILAVLNAFAAWRVMVALARLVASPSSARLRLIPISDASAGVLVKEVARLSAVAVAGYAFAEDALLFGLYRLAHDALLKLIALIVLGLVVRIVLRNRRGLKQALRAPDGCVGVTAALRNGLASTWHRIIIFYLLALWVVWALDIPNGFNRLLRLMLATVVVALVARLANKATKAGLDRLLHATDGLDEQYPGMETRLASYHPVARAAVNAVIAVVAIVAVLQAWGLDALSWFAPNALGAQVISASGTIVATLVLALATWEGVNAAIARHLAQLTRTAQLARSARLRTLLPMFRTTLLVTVCLITGLVVLSEIGVNIAPLLAGAGVIGLAIGFGSQKLVQDIITGLFLLLENAMQVGDVVTLGGMSGTVENLSIRTIRLRALDGSVHIVPFSAVTTVTNSTRDYGFAVLDISVGLNEEPDHVADILRAIATDMRAEAPWRGLILADLDVMGVERFIDTAWVLRCRIKTLPASRWAVGRELNRRIKYRFDELAIESPMTSYRALGMAPALPQPNSTPQAETLPASIG